MPYLTNREQQGREIFAKEEKIRRGENKIEPSFPINNLDSECDNQTEEEQRNKDNVRRSDNVRRNDNVGIGDNVRRNDNVSFNMEYDFQTRDNKRNLTLLEPLDPISTVGAISVSRDFITVDIH